MPRRSGRPDNSEAKRPILSNIAITESLWRKFGLSRFVPWLRVMLLLWRK
ncbi:unnamed protein product [Protopolystoma xenopodis]|uniref:Uncharacterized protein n=1 Tax=Protopolystoma xenopodis TaxID=117903 RepID=A0A448WZ23_9PLAT|nr:unnamed protein product [Protopolystoma xenopodis]